MHCTKQVLNDLLWVGADDRRLTCFEGVYGVEIDSFSDDFLVENGAKFIFNLPVGQKVLVVGEQFPDIPVSEGTVTFDGTWLVDTSTWMFEQSRQSKGCEVLEQQDIRNKWKIRCWDK